MPGVQRDSRRTQRGRRHVLARRQSIRMRRWAPGVHAMSGSAPAVAVTKHIENSLLGLGCGISQDCAPPLVAPTSKGEALEPSYKAFLDRKAKTHPATGLPYADIGRVHNSLFGWQKAIVRWALWKGRACLFEDCGLGKTVQQLAWAQKVPGNVLLLAPLAVADQTAEEARKFGIKAEVSRDGRVTCPITITNYEMMHRFDMSQFTGIVLDESSIIKSHMGKFRTELLAAAQSIPYRLACTATPSPNDHMELGNHAEFVGAMTRAEMLATYFVHDGGCTSKWRLKGHAVADFWAWVATWAVMVRTPSDIGFESDAMVLPPLTTQEHIVRVETKQEGMLFALPVQSLNDQRTARRDTMSARVAKVAAMVNDTPGHWIVWCELNAEGDALTAAIEGAVQVSGADSLDAKRAKMHAFSDGETRVLVTKPKIAGFGMNWQHCAQMAFVGLSHSFEQYYQAVRRCWRFGQERAVTVHVVSTDVEIAVLQNIKRKQAQADHMAAQMVEHMSETMKRQISGGVITNTPYQTNSQTGDGWTVHLGDCVDVVKSLPDESIDYSVFSPPFASLYTYSHSDRDMGNCVNHAEFFEHFRFLVSELFRTLKSGRLISFHCMDLPTSKARDGFIGLTDFRGALIKMFTDAGFILHSTVCIWKDPVTAMQRTKALGLLFKQLRKDSAMSRQGIPDYLITVRKPGANLEPITHEIGSETEIPVNVWQRYASPVWMDIKPNDTLQYRSAREHDDERHICPLQLGVVGRAMELWSNPGDLVLSPFTGIGTEGHVALKKGRRFVGAELKRSYYEQACRNLAAATQQLALF